MFFSLLAMVQRYSICQHVVCFFGCDLLGTFQRVIATFSVTLVVDENLDVEYLAVVFHFFVQKPKFEVLAAFLCPFEQLALEVDVGVLQFVKVDVDTDDAVDDDMLRKKEAAVEVNGTHQGLKSIAAQRKKAAARLGVLVFVFDVIVEA